MLVIYMFLNIKIIIVLYVKRGKYKEAEHLCEQESAGQ